MVFCGNCGTQVDDNVRFCPSCGGTIVAATAQQPVYQQQQAQQPIYQQQAQQPVYQQPTYQQPTYQQPPMYQQPVVPGAPMQADIRDAQDNKGMSIIAYILFFIPLLTGAHKTSPFVRYHTNQGTVLFLFSLAWGIVYWVLMAIFTAMLFNPRTWASGGWGALGVITTLLGILWLVPTILCVVGIINAAGGKMKPLPVIGKFTVVK